MTFKRTNITTALPYANGPIHIGHLAGVYIPADIYARYLRLKGEEVIFVCGSDEHGVPITIKARAEGVSPQEIVDRYHTIIKKSFEDFGIEFDIYSRTSSKIHHKIASDFFKKLYDKGEFIEQISEQYYDQEARQFLADRYITGTCPHCSNEQAYGDQCEACGTSLNPTDLINPKSAISGSKPVMRETKHWYLPLDKHEKWLQEWILKEHNSNDEHQWKPNVVGQCKSWLDMGLHPRAVTRDLDWGVSVPLPNVEGKVLYVWFDAPIGYISNTVELCENQSDKYGNWEKWWKDEQTRLIHFIGKDNIVFHCIVFPAMLKAEGSFILPENVPANEFLNLENGKISTSRNWAVWLHEYLTDFPDKQDVLRYVLTANTPETKDNDFTWKDFQQRNNSELVAILGNFVNRVMVLTNKYFKGEVPEFSDNDLKDIDKIIFNESFLIKKEMENKYLNKFKFRDALNSVMEIARLGNKYLAETEPWKLANTDMGRVAAILNTSLQITAFLSIVAEPFLPFSAKKLANMLNFDTSGKWNTLDIDENKQINNICLLPFGHKINQAELLFEKIEDDAIDFQINKLQKTKKENETPINSSQGDLTIPSPQGKARKGLKETVAFEDFQKLDIRIGTVLECQKVPKSDKLLQFKIDDGMGCRTILSGIATSYPEPEKLVGSQVCFIANFATRKLRGIDSEGMILSAELPDGQLIMIQPKDKIIEGSCVV